MKTMKVPPHESRVVPHTPGSALTSGTYVDFAGGVAGVIADIAAGVEGGVVIGGLHKVAKTTGQAWTEGQKIYLDDANAEFTNVASTHNLAGFAARAAASGDTEGWIYLAEPPGT